MKFQNLYDPAALFDKQRLEFATVVGLMQDSLSPELRTSIKAQHHRQAVAASLCARFPNLASDVCALIADDSGDQAIDLISTRLAALRSADSDLFETIPNRDEMLALCVKWQGSATADQRASLWASYCDRSEDCRLIDAYKFRKAIAERAANTVVPHSATPAPSLVHVSGKIAGGPEGTMQDIITRERPGKISGVTPATAATTSEANGERPRGENPGMIGR